MFIAKVIGNVWATQKSNGLKNKKLLLVKRLKISESSRQLADEAVLAVCDKIDAGFGDYVLVMDEGGSARSILGDKTAPVRTIIVGIIDQIQCGHSTFNVQSGRILERGSK